MLFTLGLLAVYRVGGHIPTPGINKEAWRRSSTRRRTRCSVCATCSRARTRADDDFRARHHAVHQLVDHPQLLTLWHAWSSSRKKRTGRRKITSAPATGRFLNVVQALGIAYFRKEHRDRRWAPLVYARAGVSV